ncbi:MAG: hypothetical protein QXJ28_02005, partial [Candidatus Pacearchaeota archaeon]
DIKLKDHYIFAEELVEGKKINFFVSKLEMPFKVADIMIIYSDTYCFLNPPERIREKISELGRENITNIKILERADQLRDCVGKKVCFSGDCEIDINCNDEECNLGYVIKGGRRMYFINELLYGAIFSSYENYKCNLKRIIKRTNKLAEIYYEKAQLITSRGCNSGVEGEMNNFVRITENFRRDEEISDIYQLSKDIEEKNKEALCKLF